MLRLCCTIMRRAAIETVLSSTFLVMDCKRMHIPIIIHRLLTPRRIEPHLQITIPGRPNSILERLIASVMALHAAPDTADFDTDARRTRQIDDTGNRMQSEPAILARRVELGGDGLVFRGRGVKAAVRELKGAREKTEGRGKNEMQCRFSEQSPDEDSENT